MYPASQSTPWPSSARMIAIRAYGPEACMLCEVGDTRSVGNTGATISATPTIPIQQCFTCLLRQCLSVAAENLSEDSQAICDRDSFKSAIRYRLACEMLPISGIVRWSVWLPRQRKLI